MKASKVLLIASLSASLAGCASKIVNEGAGYSLLAPSGDTAVYIVKHDKPFAQQVAAHNRQCKSDQACQK